MSRRTRTRSAGTMLLTAIVAALVASPVPAAGHGPVQPAAAPRQRSADLAPALRADRTLPVARSAAARLQPDGRIRLGTGPFVGDDIYNTTGVGQKSTGSAPRGSSVTFGISMQDDGTNPDGFTVMATGTATSDYSVKYFHGTTDITAEVVAGTYVTSFLAPGGKFLITAKVTVKSTATVGSKVTRLVTITSGENSAKKDAVKFTGKRA